MATTQPDDREHVDSDVRCPGCGEVGSPRGGEPRNNWQAYRCARERTECRVSTYQVFVPV